MCPAPKLHIADALASRCAGPSGAVNIRFPMPDKVSTPPTNGSAPDACDPDVFAVYGVEPEVQAYAMAKYSRSALSMKESLREISQQKAEKFLNTFFFQYGHRSIADLA